MYVDAYKPQQVPVQWGTLFQSSNMKRNQTRQSKSYSGLLKCTHGHVYTAIFWWFPKKNYQNTCMFSTMQYYWNYSWLPLEIKVFNPFSFSYCAQNSTRLTSTSWSLLHLVSSYSWDTNPPELQGQQDQRLPQAQGQTESQQSSRP